MNDRIIGRVISVDSFRLIIELDKETKSLYKSGFEDIYAIARINSYVILPVGDDRVIGLITRVKICDETEIEASSGNITLPKSYRYIVATMIGTIQNNKYIQGVYNYPILDNPVWYIIKEDLDKIFDYNKNENINLKEDYYLPIGTSPAFNDYEIKINPDKFFSKHSAILGNTGSGKSCTVATILQSLFSFKYKNNGTENHLNNAQIIIFDTNGEYKKAFNFLENNELQERINCFTISKDGLKIPYWFMNYDDFDYLFQPSANTQAPILKRAIELARNNEKVNTSTQLTSVMINTLESIIIYCKDQSKNNELNRIIFENIDDFQNQTLLKDIITTSLKDKIRKNIGNTGTFYNGDIEIKNKDELVKQLTKVINNQKQISEKAYLNENNIDYPLFFSYEDLLTEYIEQAVNENQNSQSRINEFLSTLRLRIRSYFTDDRFKIPFMLDKTNDLFKKSGIDKSLTIFLKYITGNLKEDNNDEFNAYYNKKNNNKFENKYINDKNQIIIIDLSLLPYEIIENVTGLIGRLILDFLQRIDKIDEGKDKRGKFPVAIVLEEAQNYIPEINRDSDRISISKRIFERIAREGRKYGLSLIISSQRPYELSKTVLSQCNTFIVHRLQNPEDQRYIRQLVSSANEDILNQLPILPQQHAIIMGDAVRSPVQLRLRKADPKPDSDDPEFIKNWIKETVENKIDFDNVINNWLGR